MQDVHKKANCIVRVALYWPLLKLLVTGIFLSFRHEGFVHFRQFLKNRN